MKTLKKSLALVLALMMLVVFPVVRKRKRIRVRKKPVQKLSRSSMIQDAILILWGRK